MPTLRAIAGTICGAVFQLGGNAVTIGRLTSNQLCIGDPSASRQHSRIEAVEEGFRICDLGSNIGTFVNGNPHDACGRAHHRRNP
jgi:pSer/pThr/pTyr-binding forkhead associated (FHA) protein